LLSGCAGDGQAVDAGADLAREPVDLAHAEDMAPVPDLVNSPDLAKADLVVPEDLMSLPDLVVLPDFQKCIYPGMQCNVDGECCANGNGAYLAPAQGSCAKDRCCIPDDGSSVHRCGLGGCCPGLHERPTTDMGFSGDCACVP
jgi:hypothetical protein